MVGRHTDIGHHDVGLIGVDSGTRLVERRAGCDHSDTRRSSQQTEQALAHQQAVFDHDQPGRRSRGSAHEMSLGDSWVGHSITPHLGSAQPQ